MFENASLPGCVWQGAGVESEQSYSPAPHYPECQVAGSPISRTDEGTEKPVLSQPGLFCLFWFIMSQEL